MVLASTVRLTGAEAQMPATLTTPPPPAYTLNVSGQYNQEPYGADVTPFEINYVVNVTGAAGTPTGAVTFWNGSGLACPTVSTEAPDQISGAVPPATPDLFYDQLTQSGTPASVGGTSSPLLDKNGNATFQVGLCSRDRKHRLHRPGPGGFAHLACRGVQRRYHLRRFHLAASRLQHPSESGGPRHLRPVVLDRGQRLVGDCNHLGGIGPRVRCGRSAQQRQRHQLHPFRSDSAAMGFRPTQPASSPFPNSTARPPSPTSPLPSTDPAPGILCVSAGTYSTQNPIALGTPNTIQVTIFTNVGVGAVNSSSLSPRRTTAFAALFGAGLLGLLTSRKRKALRGQLLAVVCALVLSGSVLGLSACSTANLTPSGQTISPKGTYQVNIVGSRDRHPLRPQHEWWRQHSARRQRTSNVHSGCHSAYRAVVDQVNKGRELRLPPLSFVTSGTVPQVPPSQIPSRQIPSRPAPRRPLREFP